MTRHTPHRAVPHRAVILAVDTAERSGWALWVQGSLHAWGEIDMMGRGGASAADVCADAKGLAADLAPDAVLVYERPFRGTTQGQWIGAWKAAWARELPTPHRMVGVYPATWRARVLGRGLHAAKREVVRPVEQSVATALADAAQPGDIGPDAAAAVCIGYWATHAPEVAKKLPKRALGGM